MTRISTPQAFALTGALAVNVDWSKIEATPEIQDMIRNPEGPGERLTDFIRRGCHYPQLLWVQRDLTERQIFKVFHSLTPTLKPKMRKDMVPKHRGWNLSGSVDFSLVTFHEGGKTFLRLRDSVDDQGLIPLDIYDGFALFTEDKHKTLHWLNKNRGVKEIAFATVFASEDKGHYRYVFVRLVHDVDTWYANYLPADAPAESLPHIKIAARQSTNIHAG